MSTQYLVAAIKKHGTKIGGGAHMRISELAKAMREDGLRADMPQVLTAEDHSWLIPSPGRPYYAVQTA